MHLKVYIVDDNEAFRRSTAWLLEAADMDVLDFADGPSMLHALTVERPPTFGCVVSDICMPGMGGLQLFEELRRRHIRLPVVFVTAHGDVPLAVDAMRRGAAHFIEKPFSAETLVQAVRTAAGRPVGDQRPPDADSKLARLSPRERQVLDLVLTGKLNKTIADILGISVKTVEMHRANLMAKLGVNNTHQLLRLVLSPG